MDKLINTLPWLVFREDFANRASVLHKGWTVNGFNNVFSNGTYSSLDNSYLSLPNSVLSSSGTKFSIAAKFKTHSSNFLNKDLFSGGSNTLRFWSYTDGDIGFWTGGSIAVTSTGNILKADTTYNMVFVSDGTSLKVYLDGVLIASNSTPVNSTLINLRVGSGYNLSGANITWYNWDFYNRDLSAEEVNLLYEGKVDRELSPENTLLDYRSTNGVVEDLTGLNTLTSTDVSIKKNGAFHTAEFNGTTSKIDCGSDFIGTKAITVMGWINAKSFGEYNRGMIVNNGKFWFLIWNNTPFFNRIVVTNDGNNTVISTIDSFSSSDFNKDIFLVTTRNSDGSIKIYKGDKDTAPVEVTLQATNAGLITAGTTNVILGNNDSQFRTFDGQIPLVTIKEGILSQEQITQHWAETRKEV